MYQLPVSAFFYSIKASDIGLIAILAPATGNGLLFAPLLLTANQQTFNPVNFSLPEQSLKMPELIGFMDKKVAYQLWG
ncbi:MAG: hypothetical protein MUC87_08110 [Bacteroidia bacterium]|nr:hypothetical protein [Bacteroidia bacterium]